LLDEIEAVVELLASFPEIGRPRNELRADVRSFRVRGFRHIIFIVGRMTSSFCCVFCMAPGKSNRK
jgi:plasmid stabilization system protein ParE